MIDLYEELWKIIKVFHEEKIPYALCGGLAYSFYVAPRATVDIDLVIQGGDFERIQKSLAPLGYEKFASRMVFAQGKMVIERLTRLIPEKGEFLLVDFIFCEPLPAEVVWEQRRGVPWRGLELWVVSKEGLIFLKKMRGSPQDQADLEELMKKEQADEGNSS